MRYLGGHETPPSNRGTIGRIIEAYLRRVYDPSVDGYVDLTIEVERSAWESRGSQCDDPEAVQQALQLFRISTPGSYMLRMWIFE